MIRFWRILWKENLLRIYFQPRGLKFYLLVENLYDFQNFLINARVCVFKIITVVSIRNVILSL